jgi:hypothetical protein
MFTTTTRAGIEILINPAHVTAAMNTPDGPELEMVTGRKYNLPREEWPIIRAALNVAVPKGWDKVEGTNSPKKFTPIY